MKYLLLLTLILTACSTKPVPAPAPSTVRSYSCSLFTAHGSYAHIDVGAYSLEEAIKTAETVRDRLVKQQVIPNCGVICEIRNNGHL